ncbi:unnamed protein product, partial [Amoebophrya sp. A25]|eukprot:GSA25T00022880001.1
MQERLRAILQYRGRPSIKTIVAIGITSTKAELQYTSARMSLSTRWVKLERSRKRSTFSRVKKKRYCEKSQVSIRNNQEEKKSGRNKKICWRFTPTWESEKIKGKYALFASNKEKAMPVEFNGSRKNEGLGQICAEDLMKGDNERRNTLQTSVKRRKKCKKRVSIFATWKRSNLDIKNKHGEIIKILQGRRWKKLSLAIFYLSKKTRLAARSKKRKLWSHFKNKNLLNNAAKTCLKNKNA